MKTNSRARMGWFAAFGALILCACAELPSNPLPTAPAPVVEVPSPTPEGVEPNPDLTPGQSSPSTESPQANATSVATAAPTALTGSAPARLRVAIVKEGNLWLWTEGESLVQLTTSGGVTDARLSDDGTMVTFTREAPGKRPGATGSELWAIGSNGTHERRLVSADELNALDPSAENGVGVGSFDWVPGRHEVALNTSPIFVGPGLAFFDDLRLVDADDPTLRTLLAPGEGGRFFYSPDAQKIALVTSGDYRSVPGKISLVDSDGSNRRDAVVTYPSVLTYSEYAYYAEPVWAADSRSLVVVIPSPDPFAADANNVIWRIPADDSEPRPLATIERPTFLYSVSVAPDLNRVAYTRQIGEPSENRFELHIASVDGSNDFVFLADSLNFDSWSADSTRFVFRFNRSHDSPQLAEVVGGYRPLIEGVPIQILRWVDADRFLYETQGGDVRRLRLGSPGDEGTPIAETISYLTYDFVWISGEASAGCVNGSQFVADVNVPDGTHFAPGNSFTKTWRLRNTGTCAWDAAYQFRFIEGVPLGAPAAVGLNRSVQPGETVEISVNFTAPQVAGTYQSRWQLFDPSGSPFGQKPYVQIVVP